MTDLQDPTAATCPVTDWATDFDHTDPVWVNNPFPIWDDLRTRCPVAHSERYNGVYLPTRHEDISLIAHDTQHFTSKSVIVNNAPVLAEAPAGGAPPITSDPPYHQHARRALLPAFSPKSIEPLTDSTRALCERLLDTLEADVSAGRDIVDAADEYAGHIPPAPSTAPVSGSISTCRDEASSSAPTMMWLISALQTSRWLRPESGVPAGAAASAPPVIWISRPR